jgi:hypothetical protein
MGIKRDIADLITEAKSLADMANTDFVTDQDWIDYINAAYREAFMQLSKSYEDWNIDSQLITTSSGTRDYAVDTDFIKLRKIMYVRDYGLSSEKEYPIKRVNWMATDSTPRLERIPRRYRLQGSNIRFFPMPEATLYYRAYFTPAPSTLTAGSTSVEFEFGMDRFIVWDAVVRALVKEKSDTSEAVKERDRHLADLILSADPRDASEAMQIQEVEYNSDIDWWEWTW